MTALGDLDLNLLVALHALLEERHVTRAARRLGLSQPATSACLARLRRHFDDPLLTRVGGGYELTPLASSLVAPTAAAVGAVRRVFSGQPDFDPARTDREFTLVLSDYALAVVGGELVRAARDRAPGARFRFTQVAPAVLDDVGGTLRRVDGLLMPRGLVRGHHPSVDLFEDRWVLIAAEGGAATRQPVTTELLASLPWVVAYRGANQHPLPPGVEPEVAVENFQSLPLLVAGTDRVAMIQRRLARLLRGVADLRVLDHPWPAPPFVQSFWFHPRHVDDAGHRWLRGLLTEVGRGLPER
ncbi:LysR family transcriptional regulator [Saccharothrix sp. Mg75]|uniref:LysR family transcriptional regulator n=1 Tax=Saccharothrix sp. Mg75 TaxID=3445357 RepID=UPI003EF052F9